ncbi:MULTISPECIES: DNA-binding protein WhiA [Priestia]|jgi:DNA-binding protein WhiA|uniref:Probable cell division protein WhiA n=2 Tax=Priestia TaxID=2800373 RepID=D5DVG4_PRIM1|nr:MULTISPECIES: DNA-binding protein WhiA [Priestia]AVX10896.1 DNA-binding protein WhiA [Bacillus sp. Y-01]KOP76958.1 sporulation regulator WhiA [Bacillus sp. FJAT-21351]KQU18243.1 sporulation regulator WhiA [Bacillus sp. Leaf75]MBZ5481913.1 DNA-binding protein WhiA [Bacillus sp. T_4]MDH6651949.1 DNA-binding protein WhiA [Bacillus sp. PvP124]MDP9578769.1 DNA-binding protein WhiA [Bacillus sp. 1751]RFB35207.1 DNA-binding protein WhiA [Bacillus sp. RC]
MSFASETKKELTNLEVKDCCAKAELSALIRMNGSLSFSNKKFTVDVQTENAAIARRIYVLLKKNYDVSVELLVRKKMRLKKNNVYIVRLVEKTRMLLEDLKIVEEGFTFTHRISAELVQKKCCKRSYLRGAFLAGGSINNPETSSYHLEIFSLYEEHNEALCNLMNEFQLNSKTLERKKGYINYLKEAEKITEFLNIIGAHNALLRFEDVRIVRDMRNSVNRLVNCETANLNKTIGAAIRQVENIRYIDETAGLDILPEKLREIARLRVEYQDVTLKELGEMVSGGQISKSGINHRLRKIDQIADKLRAGQPVT